MGLLSLLVTLLLLFLLVGISVITSLDSGLLIIDIFLVNFVDVVHYLRGLLALLVLVLFLLLVSVRVVASLDESGLLVVLFLVGLAHVVGGLLGLLPFLCLCLCFFFFSSASSTAVSRLKTVLSDWRKQYLS
ncbi:hypothetical protein F5Y16DRAFT_143095 [Xylariaceae sp. FL0255]|nr:hypothetical protein F5Y16DRAFT_143095 [Xylariaceae sp. FL0255]